MPNTFFLQILSVVPLTRAATYLEFILGLEACSRLSTVSGKPEFRQDHCVHIFSTCVVMSAQAPWVLETPAYASRMCSGMLASTLLISPGPKPVAVRLCLGRVKPGPTGPCSWEIGAPMEGFRSRGSRWVGDATVAAAMVMKEDDN